MPIVKDSLLHIFDGSGVSLLEGQVPLPLPGHLLPALHWLELEVILHVQLHVHFPPILLWFLICKYRSYKWNIFDMLRRARSKFQFEGVSSLNIAKLAEIGKLPMYAPYQEANRQFKFNHNILYKKEQNFVQKHTKLLCDLDKKRGLTAQESLELAKFKQIIQYRIKILKQNLKSKNLSSELGTAISAYIERGEHLIKTLKQVIIFTESNCKKRSLLLSSVKQQLIPNPFQNKYKKNNESKFRRHKNTVKGNKLASNRCSQNLESQTACQDKQCFFRFRSLEEQAFECATMSNKIQERNKQKIGKIKSLLSEELFTPKEKTRVNKDSRDLQELKISNIRPTKSAKPKTRKYQIDQKALLAQNNLRKKTTERKMERVKIAKTIQIIEPLQELKSKDKVMRSNDSDTESDQSGKTLDIRYTERSQKSHKSQKSSRTRRLFQRSHIENVSDITQQTLKSLKCSQKEQHESDSSSPGPSTKSIELSPEFIEHMSKYQRQRSNDMELTGKNSDKISNNLKAQMKRRPIRISRRFSSTFFTQEMIEELDLDMFPRSEGHSDQQIDEDIMVIAPKAKMSLTKKESVLRLNTQFYNKNYNINESKNITTKVNPQTMTMPTSRQHAKPSKEENDNSKQLMEAINKMRKQFTDEKNKSRFSILKQNSCSKHSSGIPQSHPNHRQKMSDLELKLIYEMGKYPKRPSLNSDPKNSLSIAQQIYLNQRNYEQKNYSNILDMLWQFRYGGKMRGVAPLRQEGGGEKQAPEPWQGKAYYEMKKPNPIIQLRKENQHKCKTIRNTSVLQQIALE